MIVKQIIGVSIPPDRSWSGLRFWPAAQVSIYAAGGRAPQIGKRGEKRQGGETMTGLETETQEGRGRKREMYGAEGSVLTPSISH